MNTQEIQPMFQSRESEHTVDHSKLNACIETSWSKLSTFWPIDRMVGVNPLAGYEHLDFTEAVEFASSYLMMDGISEQLDEVNRITIKWLQVFYDTGQAPIAMPMRDQGLLKAVLAMLPYDSDIVKKAHWLLSKWNDEEKLDPLEVITDCLGYYNLNESDYEPFMTLILSSLPGWTAHAKYRAKSADVTVENGEQQHLQEYLALRLVVSVLSGLDANDTLRAFARVTKNEKVHGLLNSLENNEQTYRKTLIRSLDVSSADVVVDNQHEAQFLFCIDVRSEPMRRAIESVGPYQTYGCAGFFGLPIAIEHATTGHSYDSCPVLLQPSKKVLETPCDDDADDKRGYQRQRTLSNIYKSLKYSFTTPLCLAEAIGSFCGVLMAFNTFAPKSSSRIKRRLKHLVRKQQPTHPNLDSLTLQDRVAYASGLLQVIGLTENFAPAVVIVGHGSETTNNAFAASLDCGACGGNGGFGNAKVFSTILNDPDVRTALAQSGIVIPETTQFIAAQHNTTTDRITLYTKQVPETEMLRIDKLKGDLEQAVALNVERRLQKLKLPQSRCKASEAERRALDWSEVRPEWGLANNCAILIGPRNLTQNTDLDGRVFLHSYDWTKDNCSLQLSAIMAAPVIVAQWINSQYLFSSFDNVAFGGGCKTTANLAGKIGVMQGNASDLMTGLPLQSLYIDEQTPYHELLRLQVVVYAPRSALSGVINCNHKLAELFDNHWISLICIDPLTHKFYLYKGYGEWTQLNAEDA